MWQQELNKQEDVEIYGSLERGKVVAVIASTWLAELADPVLPPAFPVLFLYGTKYGQDNCWA